MMGKGASSGIVESAGERQRLRIGAKSERHILSRTV